MLRPAHSGILAATLALLAGCSTTPVTGVAAGPRFEAADVAFVQVGETIVDDVVLRLGTPYLVRDEQRALAYACCLVTEDFTWLLVPLDVVLLNWVAPFSLRTRYRTELLMVAWDEAGRITRTESRTVGARAPSRRIGRVLEDWADR